MRAENGRVSQNVDCQSLACSVIFPLLCRPFLRLASTSAEVLKTSTRALRCMLMTVRASTLGNFGFVHFLPLFQRCHEYDCILVRDELQRIKRRLFLTTYEVEVVHSAQNPVIWLLL